MSLTAKEAIDRLDPQKWASTGPAERLALLHSVRDRLGLFAEELAAADTKMKNGLMGEEVFDDDTSMMGTVVPLANTVSACIDLYEFLENGKMPEPIRITPVGDDRFDIHVFPQQKKDKLMYADRKDVLRVKGEPRQVSPYDKPSGIIAVLGAGNYSSSLEMVKALFLENCAVVHKPHHLNEDTDAVWEKIMQPLVDTNALTFCSADQSRIVTQDERLSKIYFTGGTGTAKAIMAATDTPLISECGGNNPCIIVPGDRPWSDKEIAHQAVQIATIGKLNGGAVCGRVQTVVTSRNWPQRDAFLDALRRAIEVETPAAGTYYPGSDEVSAGFKKAYPSAEVYQPEGGRYTSGEFVLIPDAGDDGYAVHNEAFCQILSEVALDTPAEAEAFLPAAVSFANDRLLGTLGCAILIDEDTRKAHEDALQQAVTDLDYGGIAVNTMPPFIFLNPYLTWGGNEEGKEFVSGVGNFGNLLGYVNVEKSIIYAGFMSAGHMMITNKQTSRTMFRDMSRYSAAPTWGNLGRMMVGAIVGGLRKKDF